MKPISVILLTMGLAASMQAGPPPMPKTPAPVDELVYARPFSVEEGFKFIWRKERPDVKDGMLLVLKADKDLLVPRAAQMPVLYVGDQTVHRLNYGDKSGYLIVIVPGKPDLTKTPIWFGTPGFPDWMDASGIKAERAKADEAGIQPLSLKTVQAALARGGAPLTAANLSEVLRTEAAELILKYSPQEKHIAEGFRVPVVRRQTEDSED